MYRFTRTISMALSASVLALGFSGLATASTDPYLKQVAVSYSDLDLSRKQDAQKLYSRISQAAQVVCKTRFGITSRTNAVRNTCVTKAIGDAVDAVGNENLTAVYLLKAGKRAMVASSR